MRRLTHNGPGSVHTGTLSAGTGTIGVLLIVGLLSSCAGTDGVLRKEGPRYFAETQSWLDGLRVMGGHGYWLVTRGYHTGDDVVSVASNKRFSHASILDLENLEVIEAVGTGVIRTPLLKFLREAHRVRLIRPKGWTPVKGRAAVDRVRAQIGAKYDFLGVVGAPSKKRWYCSELAAWSMGIKVNQAGTSHVLHPANLHKFGQLLWDTQARDGTPDKPDEALIARTQALRDEK
ncbi:MAG: hypothetical protein KC502_11285 [Myxococcales bacterium]|nr:hypothetical protein [Myxococcales bacterium]